MVPAKRKKRLVRVRNRHKLFHSSSFRLALLYMMLFSLSSVALLGFIYWSTAGYMAQQSDETIETEIAGLSERYESEGLAGLTLLIQERIARKPFGSSLYLLTDANFRPLVGNLLRWPAVNETATGWLNFRLLYPQGGKSHRARARPFRLRGDFYLLVGRDIHALEKTQKMIVDTFGWGMLITLIFAMIGGMMTSRAMVRRIESINQTSREIINGDLTRRIPSHQSGDEFDELIDNLNKMLDQIESLMMSVRSVSDNIAHDLRTPLTRLRNHLEPLRTVSPRAKQLRNESLLDPGAGDSRKNEAAIERAILEADGLLVTFGALLRIARIESNQQREQFVPVDLVALIQDVIELYEPLAEEKSQSLQLNHPSQPIILNGDRDLLFQALANLLDNAIKYTPRQGEISIRLTNNQKKGSIIIADSGPGIPAEARERVLQRFYRLETSRTTTGNGLGLSLVAAVINLHHMTMKLTDNSPGLRVEIEFTLL